MPDLRIGDVVRLNVPDNPTFHGLYAEVAELAEWGCHVRVPAMVHRSAPEWRSYRAGWSELAFVGRLPRLAPAAVAVAPAPSANGVHKPTEAKAQGYTGDSCGQCGGMKLVRNGACLLCTECGSSSGCS